MLHIEAGPGPLSTNQKAATLSSLDLAPVKIGPEIFLIYQLKTVDFFKIT